MGDVKMRIGDCQKCGMRTMIILGAEAKKVFSITGLCYNCKQTFSIPGKIDRIKDDNQSAT